MNSAAARRLIHCHCGNHPDLDDPAVRKAVRFARAKKELAAELQAQLALDARLRALAAGLRPSRPFIEYALASQHAHGSPPLHWRGALKQPAILAAIIGLLVMLGFGLYFGIGYLDAFPGKEAVSRMITTTDEMSGVEFEPLPPSTQAGALGDWFFLHYGMENYNVPREFAGMTAVGCRVFKQDGKAIAQAAIEQDPNHFLFFIFRAADFGVRLVPAGRWRIFQEEDWVIAIRGEEDNCFMISMKGDKSDMNALLNTVH